MSDRCDICGNTVREALPVTDSKSSLAVFLLDELGAAADGMPQGVRDLCALICAMEIGLREEEFTREEAVMLTAAWLQGGCPH